MWSSTFAVLVLLLVVASQQGATAAERGLLQDAERIKIKIGRTAQGVPTFLTCNDAKGLICEGFEIEFAKELCARMNADCETIVLDSLEQRITALENDEADIVIDSFSVTDERKARVDFVNPFYYTSGVGLFVNDTARLPGAWDDIQDEIICIESGYFAMEAVELMFKPQFVEFDTSSARDAGLLNGECVAIVGDSTETVPAEQIGFSLFNVPYGIGIKKGRSELDAKVAGALVQMMENGQDSVMLRLERDILIAAGLRKLPNLEKLVIAISEFQ